MLKIHENISKEINSLVLDYTPCTHSNMAIPGRRKVFYISDIHCDTKSKKGFNNCSDKEYINHVITKMNGDCVLRRRADTGAFAGGHSATSTDSTLISHFPFNHYDVMLRYTLKQGVG